MTTIATVELVMIGAAVVGFAALAVVGKIVQARGIVPDPAALAPVMFPLVMGLFLLFGLGMMGLALQLFIAGQGQIGNADVGMVSFLRRHQVGVTLGFWAFLLTGFAIAYPFARRDMVGPPPPTVGPSAGMLRADIGQTLEQVRAASTLPVAETAAVAITQSTRTAGEAVFDFELPGSTVRLEQCRYYFITTGGGGSPAIDSINIGVSPYKKPKARIEADQAALRGRLATDRWEPGRFVWRTERDLQLSGGQPTTGEGRYWAKGGTLLVISTKRMDEAKPGEDAATAGEFILVLDFVPKGRGTYADLEFGPAPNVAGERPK